ncbi:NAD(P)/FAD-dependent oxidoreductase [Variovorax paradoxus]|nr:NAD(P)/FAD-dependent oxidoreductase [Variovorax paradoxus]MBT2305232.1 NAD(P)/FAD-dependent oxidoreductase [Variovorax paradoxus]
MDQAASRVERAEPTTDAQIVEAWLANFELALRDRSAEQVSGLLANECHWRDMFAYTWDISPCEGKAAIVKQLLDHQHRVQGSRFEIAKGSTPPRRVKRIGVDVIEAIFSFETSFGRGKGVVRLLAGEHKAWILMTALRELKGYEEQINERRPDGASWREFGGPNWSDRRAKEQAFEDRDPVVLIVGAGQSGLSMAARLRVLGVDALCVDKHERVGDSWRKRYHSLALHNQVNLNQMAYMPFPATWPKYLTKDMVANWLEHYAWALECNVWMRTELVGARYDANAGHWVATVRRGDGTERVMKPRHIVFANGIVGAPKIPRLPGLDDFKGQVLHTHDYKTGHEWKGRNALVLGTGTSGHDIAQDLFGHGANVKIVQRGSTAIASVEAVGLAYTSYYKENLPTEDCDLLAQSATYPIAVRNARAVTKAQNEMDKDLLAGLTARGFKVDPGEDGTGYLMKIRRTHAGYYFNCGASDLIVEGKVGLLQYEDIERFVADGALMKDGRVEKAEVLVTATGYQPQQEVVRQLLGDEVADKVGQIWGLDKDGELTNMYKPTPQNGLWFLGSGLSQARMYTLYVALQIKAREVGLVD